MIGIVGDPHKHLFTPGKNGALNKKRCNLDRIKGAVACLYLLLAYVADVEIVHLIVQEHIEGDLSAWLVGIIVDIPGVIDGRQHVLNTLRNIKYARSAHNLADTLIE